MKKIIVILVFMFGLFNIAKANYLKLAHEFEFNSIQGDIIKLSDYKDKVIVIVNVASRCGYTPQYKDLQKLSTEYQNELIVIGVPTNNFKQEPKNNAEIKKFCESNFGITFPMSEKVDVIGSNAHPFFKWAKKNHGIAAIPKWNFHKIIIGKDGKIADTFASFTKPNSKKLNSDISYYLHRPSATDKSMAPPEHDCFYVLVPVPNNQSKIDWSVEGEKMKNLVIDKMEKDLMPNLRENIVDDFYLTPDYFEKDLNTKYGSGFSIQPKFSQSAYFRFHNKSEIYDGLYFVGAGTHPGAGVPGVLSSAKVLDKIL